MIESNREIWRYFQKVEKYRNLKFEIKIASKLNLARKTKKTQMFSHFEKKRQITYKGEGNQERSGGNLARFWLNERIQ
jgi:hypothetical protein